MAEREINLSSYYPRFLRDIRELQVITRTEEEELYRLHQESGSLWSDGFISTASARGVRRWEALLGLKPYLGDSLEERRAVVLAKWNQQLPYTLPRLKERLDAAVGRAGYELSVRNQIYELELNVIDQSCRVLQSLRDMTREMIPANLFFIFAGKYPVGIPVETHMSSGLRINTYFNPRNNREYLLLDGRWPLNGSYRLNGYKELMDWEFYPLELRAAGSIAVGEQMGGARQTLVLQVMQSYQLNAAAVLRNSAAHHIAMAANSCLRTGLFAQAGTGSKIKAETYIKSTIAIRTVSRASGSCRELASAYPGLEVTTRTSIAVNGTAGLKIEKDLWHLDGSYQLDGEKLLDAEIIEYNL